MSIQGETLRPLAVPLTAAQVETTGTLHRELAGWATTDPALRLLGERCPGFGPEATLLKVVAINQLYGTNVYAVTRMARHVADELARDPLGATAEWRRIGRAVMRRP